MDQSLALWLRVVRTRTITRPDCRGPEKNKVKWRYVVLWNSTHNRTVVQLTLVLMSTGHGVELLALPLVECLPVSVHMCSASHLHLYLLVVHMCITATVILVRAHAS